MRKLICLISCVLASALAGQEVSKEANLPLVDLVGLETVSTRVALEESPVTYSMPVSELRYLPQVDIQSRNSSESQGDVSIRGGIFENTGFQLAGITLMDPQTGHYAAEIPVATRMLEAAEVLTGSANAFSGMNSSVGTIAMDWAAMSPGGELSVGYGEENTWHASLYQAWVQESEDGSRWGFDFETSHSESDGLVQYGDHEYHRYNLRFQRSTKHSKTDVFAGYQSKFFGWWNLYTPYNVPETEDLNTSLIMLSHRQDLGDGQLSFSAYYRRNLDDYEFDRTRPGLYNPYEHETQVKAASVQWDQLQGEWLWSARLEAWQDDIESTSLLSGYFDTRDYWKLAVAAERAWSLTGEWNGLVRGGLSFDDTSRDGSAVSPLLRWEVSRRGEDGEQQVFYADLSRSTQVAGYTAIASSPTGGLFRGNQDLGREHADNYELGYVWKRGALQLQAAAFYRKDSDLVDWTYSGSGGRQANHVDIDSFGVEAFGTWNYEGGHVSLGYTALSKDEDYGDATVVASFYALNYARHRFTVSWVQQLAAGLDVRLDHEYRVQEANALRSNDVDDALIGSVGLFYTPEFADGLELNVTVENLWDSDFEEVPAVPASPRFISCGATYRY